MNPQFSSDDAPPAPTLSPMQRRVPFMGRLEQGDLLLAALGIMLAGVALTRRTPVNPDLTSRLALLMVLPLLVARWGGWAGIFSIAVGETLVRITIQPTPRISESVVWLLTYVGLAVWIRSQLKSSAAVRSRAQRDPLTGLFNRQTLCERLEAEWHRTRRYPRPFALALLDCDGFKPLNDRYGHLVGDVVLRRIATVLQAQVRGYDTCCRWGGDEFVLLFPETDLQEVEVIVERIQAGLRHALEREFEGLSVSLGAVVFRSPPLSPTDCLQAADDAMYAAKRRGRGGVEIRLVESIAGDPLISE